MFPLKQRKIIRGCAAHIKAGLGCGIDWVAVYVDLFSPFDGKIETFYGTQGGNWIRLVRPNGDRIEFAHLSKYLVTNGETVKAGDKIAVTGNTGSITTNPHLHCQIFRDGKRLDPERYNWEENVIIDPMTCETEKKEIQRLNTQLWEEIAQKNVNEQKWQSELTRANTYKKALEVEEEGHRQTLEQLKTSQAEVTKLEAEMKKNRTIIEAMVDVIREYL